jgi:hypothetical protein
MHVNVYRIARTWPALISRPTPAVLENALDALLRGPGRLAYVITDEDDGALPRLDRRRSSALRRHRLGAESLTSRSLAAAATPLSSGVFSVTSRTEES